MTKYLSFIKDDSYIGKTGVFHIYHNESEELLGLVKWNCGFRQYCFYPESDTHWSNGCLQEVKEFVGRLMVERMKADDVKQKDSEVKNAMPNT